MKKNKKENEKLRVCLYLDDVRTPTEVPPNYSEWNIVRNYDEFKDFIIKNGIPDLISFDHDLSDEHMNDYFNQVAVNGYQHPDYEVYKEKTGLDCARFLVEYSQKMNIPIKSCCVHSHNPVGATNIQSFINGFKRYSNLDEDCYLGKFSFTVENK
jgi:hypothetical protein